MNLFYGMETISNFTAFYPTEWNSVKIQTNANEKEAKSYDYLLLVQSAISKLNLNI